MGLWDQLSEIGKPKIDQGFVDVVRAFDNDEEWAKNRIRELWERNDSTLVPRMDEARILIYENAAHQGDLKAQYWLGMSLRGINKKEALFWLEGLANRGDIDAIKGIAYGYTEYGGFGDDNNEYVHWMRKAAELGDAEAQASIAGQYFIIGLEQRALKYITEAIHWYKLSAEQNYYKGYIGLGEAYERERDQKINELYGKSMSDTDIKKQVLEIEESYECKIEDAYIGAMNYAENRADSADAAFALGFFYRRLLRGSHIANSTAKRAAYFLYVSHLCKHPNALKWFNEVVTENALNVNTNDIENWADQEKIFD